MSGQQKHGQQLTVENARSLKLLWKQPLSEPVVTAPLIMGPTITHRGVRELVFIGGKDNLYAFDADLGTLFWKRHLEGLTGTPVFEPDPDADVREDDEPGPMRPLYAVSGDGRLHAIRVSDGSDISAVDFLPAGTTFLNLNYWQGVVYAGNKEGVWSIDVRKPAAKVQTTHTPIEGAIAIRKGMPYSGKPDHSVTVSGVRLDVVAGILKAFDGVSGKQIYSSPQAFPISTPDLAVANGHICFAVDALYCYGIPMER